VASKKQRRRRQKEQRHEYELVVVDETGEERPVDPDELREKRREKEAARDKPGKPGTKAQPAKGARSGRQPREVQPPSWGRVWKRVAFFGVFMLLVLNFVGKGQAFAPKVGLTVLYTALFVPFIYLMDRVQYRQYLRRSGQEEPPRAGRAGRAAKQAEKPKPKPATPDGDRSESKALAGLRRGFRR
jgi:hypothetical protein